MIRDLISSYGKYFEDDKIVLDNYDLQDGIYVLITKDGIIKNILEVEKNNRETQKVTEEYNYFKERDFYSNVISANKSISTEIKELEGYKTSKKLLSNNILTLFFKSNIIEMFNKEQEKGDKEGKSEILPINILKDVIAKYFESIEVLGQEKKEDKLLLESFKIQEIEKEKLEKYKSIFKNNIEKILYEVLSEFKEIKKNTRIKVFIEEDISIYKIASMKYFLLKIFNDNKSNVLLEDTIHGMNAYNFGMNSKKEYLELKTTSYKVPSRLTYKEINIVRNMYIWILKNCSLFQDEKLDLDFKFRGDLHKKENEGFYIMKVQNDNGTAKIDNFEYINKYTNIIKEIKFKNILNKIDLKDRECVINRIENLEQYLNEVWYSKCLRCLNTAYYNREGISKLKVEEYKKKNLATYGNIFYEFFHKLNDKPLKQQIGRIGNELAKGCFLEEVKDFCKYKGRLYNTTICMNSYLILEQYLKGKEIVELENKIEYLKIKSRNIINSIDIIKTDEEFFFLLGQVSYYLLSQSKAEKINQDVIDPILEAASVERVKKELEYLYKRYKHEIALKNKKFNKAFTEVLAYETEQRTKNNLRIILIGILSDSLFYEKNGGNEDGKDE